MYLSPNNGTSWAPSGLQSFATVALVANNTYLFAATDGHGLCRRPLSSMLSSVKSSWGDGPTIFKLHQNYPNPFDPSTTIRYALPQRSQVTLTVYTTLGQQVAQLVNGEVEAGYHEAVFDAKGLASGVYFYRWTVGSFVETKKILLLR